MIGEKFPHLGFDPAPGDVDHARRLSRDLAQLAGELGTTVRTLERLEAAEGTQETAGSVALRVAEEATSHVRRTRDTFDRTARALGWWARQLHGFQAEARALESEAARTREGTGGTERASGEGAREELARVRQRAQELAARVIEAARAAERELDVAGSIAPDGVWLTSSSAVSDREQQEDWTGTHARTGVTR